MWNVYTMLVLCCFFSLSSDSCQRLKLSCLQGKLSPPLPPKKVMIYMPPSSSSPTPLPLRAPSLQQHVSMGGHYGHPLQLQYGGVHPSSRIIDELQKTLAFAMQRLERFVLGLFETQHDDFY